MSFSATFKIQAEEKDFSSPVEESLKLYKAIKKVNKLTKRDDYYKKRVFVKLKENLEEDVSKKSFKSVRDLRDSGIKDLKVVNLESEEGFKEKLIELQIDERVEEIMLSHDKKLHWTSDATTATPGDYNSSRHWYLDKINLPEVWYEQNCQGGGVNCGGSSDIVVAVLDTGVAFEDYTADYTFEGENRVNTFKVANQLNGVNLWTNEGEDDTGGDDDHNGFCDDLHGVDIPNWDDNFFEYSYSEWTALCNSGTSNDVTKEGHPVDLFGHGTAVATVITSLVDDSGINSSVVGIAHNVQLMPVAISNDEGYSNTYWIYKAIQYAVDNGADIINISFGASSTDWFEEEAIRYAQENDVLIVASSGNNCLPRNQVDYPAAYALEYDNVIAVGASTTSDTRTSYSCYGDALSMVAPVGSSVWVETYIDASFNNGSTPFNTRDFESMDTQYEAGTSFSSPQVAAAAATLKSEAPHYSASDLRQALISTARDIEDTGWDREVGYGVLDLKAAWDRLWGDWEKGGGVSSNVEMIEYGGELYQSMRSWNNMMYYRVYNGSAWEPWQMIREMKGNVEMEVYDNKLYQSVRGWDRRQYLRSFDGSTWSDWEQSGGMDSNMKMEVYDGKLYQAMRSWNNRMYMRTFDGSTWTPWEMGRDMKGDVEMVVYDNKLYQSVRGWDRREYTRYFDGSSWSEWSGGGGMSSNMTMAVYNGKLHQAMRSWNNRMYMRYYNSATDTWSPWTMHGGILEDVTMAEHGGKLYQSMRSWNKNLYTRYLDGDTWMPWVMNRDSEQNISLYSYNGKLYQVIAGLDRYLYTRNLLF